MKRGIWLSMAAALAVAAAAQNAAAATASFAYQGVILEQDGTVPATKNRTIEFRVYDGPTSTRALWGRAYNVLLDANGLFNTPLSDETGSPISGVDGTGMAKLLAEHSGSTLYVGLTVDGSSGEISPRQAILAVPYAIHAADAAGASGDFAVAGKATAAGLTVSGASTMGSVQADSLSVKGNVALSTSGSFSGYGSIPKGGIIMWSGAANAVPDGWALCDGANGTPDLRGRFVVGYDPGHGDYNSPGKKGGEEKHKLTAAEMPSHNHSMTMYGGDIADDWKQQNNLYLTWDKYGMHNTRYTDTAGGDQAHENRPPYYAICFIMRIK